METNLLKEKFNNLPLGIVGLGGWLILVQIGLFFTTLMLLIQLFQYTLPAFSAETWNMLTSNQSEHYHQLWGPVIIFESIFNVLFLIFCVYILINFYGKKSILPRLMIIFYSSSLIYGVIDLILLYQIPFTRELEDGSSINDLLRSVIACAIWIPYFIKSVRVHNTFIK